MRGIPYSAYLRPLMICLSTLFLLMGNITHAFAVSRLAPNPIRTQQTETVIKINPTSQTVKTGQTVTVEVQIDNVANLAGVDIKLVFDPTILQVQDADPAKEGVQIQLGDFLVTDPTFPPLINNADNITGTIRFALTQLAPRPPANGSGLIASITFKGIATGNTQISFTQVKLATYGGDPITVTAQTGNITVVSDQPTVTPTPPSYPLHPKSPPSSCNCYVVRQGDTLFSIARQYQIPVWHLATYNHIYNFNFIYISQILNIPNFIPFPTPNTYYVVRPGDTFFSIALRYGFTMPQLAAYNNISNPGYIYVGQVIHFPHKYPN